MHLEEELLQFQEDERSVFAEQLRQLNAEPMPIAYGLLARINTREAAGWFWTGRAGDGCLVSVKRIAQKSDFNLIESPSCKQWRIALLADVDAKIVLDSVHNHGGDGLSEGFENLFPAGFKHHLLTYAVEPGRQGYDLQKGSSHHAYEISLLPRFVEDVASCLSITPQKLESLLSQIHPMDHELRLRNSISSFSIGRMRSPGAELYLRGYVYQVIADLGDYLLRNQSGQARNNRLSDTEISKRVKASIADDIANPLSLDDLAAALLVSKTKLCDSFAKSEGMTIGSYLRQIRVSAAQEMLMNSDATVASISADLGFKYQNNFSAMFKRSTGKSPSEWRANRT